MDIFPRALTHVARGLGLFVLLTSITAVLLGACSFTLGLRMNRVGKGDDWCKLLGVLPACGILAYVNG
jgi:hypothetical protein